MSLPYNCQFNNLWRWAPLALTNETALLTCLPWRHARTKLRLIACCWAALNIFHSLRLPFTVPITFNLCISLPLCCRGFPWSDSSSSSSSSPSHSVLQNTNKQSWWYCLLSAVLLHKSPAHVASLWHKQTQILTGWQLSGKRSITVSNSWGNVPEWITTRPEWLRQ